MPRDSSGNYTLPAGNPVISNTPIESAWANPTMADLGNEIQNSLDRSGRGGMLVPFKVPDGSAGTPGYAFTSQPSSGMYLQAPGILGLSVASQATLRLTSGRVEFEKNATPATNNALDLGTSSMRWRNMMLGGRADIGTANSFVHIQSGGGDGGSGSIQFTAEDGVDAYHFIGFSEGADLYAFVEAGVGTDHYLSIQMRDKGTTNPGARIFMGGNTAGTGADNVAITAGDAGLLRLVSQNGIESSSGFVVKNSGYTWAALDDDSGSAFAEFLFRKNGVARFALSQNNANDRMTMILRDASQNTVSFLSFLETGTINIAPKAGQNVTINNDPITAPVVSGVYTPTITPVANANNPSTQVGQYIRVGSIVFISGRFTANITAANQLVTLNVSLPIASNFASGTDLVGTASINAAFDAAYILADATAKTLQVTVVPALTGSRTFFYSGSYRIR